MMLLNVPQRLCPSPLLIEMGSNPAPGGATEDGPQSCCRQLGQVPAGLLIHFPFLMGSSMIQGLESLSWVWWQIWDMAV